MESLRAGRHRVGGAQGRGRRRPSREATRLVSWPSSSLPGVTRFPSDARMGRSERSSARPSRSLRKGTVRYEKEKDSRARHPMLASRDSAPLLRSSLPSRDALHPFLPRGHVPILACSTWRGLHLANGDVAIHGTTTTRIVRVERQTRERDSNGSTRIPRRRYRTRPRLPFRRRVPIFDWKRTGWHRIRGSFPRILALFVAGWCHVARKENCVKRWSPA